MMQWSRIAVLVVLCVLYAATLAFAQEEEATEIVGGFTMMRQVIQTVMWSAAYLPLYAACLVVPMSYLQRFSGFDANLLCWIAVLWLGGMGANYIGYAVTDTRWLALLIAAPLIFGWIVLICTRSWADLSVRESLIVAAVTVICCLPYFGPTWHIHPKERPQVDLGAARPAVLAMAPCLDMPGEATQAEEGRFSL